MGATMDDDEVRVERMTLTLRALDGGAYTEVALRGPMATVPQRPELRRLFALLSFWHGGPVDVVLTVTMDSAGWLEVWSEALSGVPTRHAHVRFEIAGRERAGGGGR